MHATRWAWLLICVACGSAGSSSQPDASQPGPDADGAGKDAPADSEAASDTSVGDSAAPSDGSVGDGGDASAGDSATSDGALQDAACGLSSCVSPNSCACTMLVQVSAAQACQMLEERLQVNGYIGPDTNGSTCDAACGSGAACYVSPDYVQQAAAANGNSTGPFDAGAFVCPAVSCSVTVACAPGSC